MIKRYCDVCHAEIPTGHPVIHLRIVSDWTYVAADGSFQRNQLTDVLARDLCQACFDQKRATLKEGPCH